MKALVVVICLAGCYAPSVRDCAVSCASPNDCTGGQVCTMDGWCAAPETSCLGIAPDAANATSDGSGDLCAFGCPNGTCMAGVCVIDCSAPDTCPDDITCPPNIPCRVVCGDRSCEHKVFCGLASSCEVKCNGKDSCNDEIVCGKTPCDVSCAGAGSCTQKIKCKESCACDVSCTGLGSCSEVSECPLADACRLGRGCSSVLSGCDRCN